MNDDFRFKKYGAPTKSNIKWTYNLDPMKKWITILFGAIAFAGSVWMIRKDVVEKQAKEAAKIEAKQERGKYLERRLETIKQETIAAELAKAEAKKPNNQPRRITPRRIKSGPPIYTWTNENGQTVYSNKPNTK